MEHPEGSSICEEKASVKDEVQEQACPEAESAPAAEGEEAEAAGDNKDAVATADSKNTSKKPKKTKQGWKNRFGKQKLKGAAAQDTSENPLIRRPFHPAYKFRRNRSNSFPSGSKFFLPYMRPRKETFIPPTKFLLGGNISDPLNLNSLQDEDVNRAMNAVTPKSSPLPTPPRHRAKIEVIIPPDIRDPLNLLDPLEPAEYEKSLEMKKPRRGKKGKWFKRRSSEGQPGNAPAASPPPAEPVTQEAAEPVTQEAAEPADAPPTPAPSTSAAPTPHKRPSLDIDGGSAKKLRRLDSLDKIVSPVIPQPGAWVRVHMWGGGHGHATRGRGGHGGHGNHGHGGHGYGHSLRGGAGHATRGGRAGCTSKGRLTRAPMQADAERPPAAKSCLPKFRPQDARYQYGNYDRYYGYRNLDAMMDIRLKVFGGNRHLFLNKDVLDIGCNVGHISIAVARDLGAKSVTGIDIDNTLIARARQNLTNFVIIPQSPPKSNPAAESSANISDNLGQDTSMDTTAEESLTTEQRQGIAAQDKKKEEGAAPEAGGAGRGRGGRQGGRKMKRGRRTHHKHIQEGPKSYFPMSCPILYGPAMMPACPSKPEASGFPHNITFQQGNYVLKDENLILADPLQYDLIMCLSVSKWLHLNWGDAGLKLAFKRMFAQLRPGGKLILEAQGWASYNKKKKLTETIFKNFSTIEFFPNKFRDYLLSPEVGFSKCCVLAVPQHLSKGFRRPIHLYIKGDFTPSKVQWSDTYAPSSHHQAEPGGEEQPAKVYAGVVSPSYHPTHSVWSFTDTPLYGAVTPQSFRMENNSAEASPFYNPRSDSYLPSYTSSGQQKTVYASLSSPLSDYGGTPVHTSENSGDQSGRGVYATIASPASPFLEPSPGNSATPGHPFTPSHSANCDAQSERKKVYASLHSPQEDRGQPVYSPSVAGSSRRAGGSPLHTGCSPLPPGCSPLHLPSGPYNPQDLDNNSSSGSPQLLTASPRETTNDVD